MILQFIENIVRESKEKGENPLYTRSRVKEYFQILVLYYIYTNKNYKSNFIFTGGTCLRHFHNLERLSEDLDFDTLQVHDPEELSSNLNKFFNERLNYKYLNISIKQQGRQILLKFPVLKALGLANTNESDLLYIKCDLENINYNNYNIIKSTKSTFGYNFVVTHYDLPSLFAGKVTAVLTRNLLKGKDNRATIKGRDFYDLLWYLKSNVPINFELVKERLKKPDLEFSELKEQIHLKVKDATSKFQNDFKNDLLAFISDTDFLDDYVENYFDEFKRYEITKR